MRFEDNVINSHEALPNCEIIFPSDFYFSKRSEAFDTQRFFKCQIQINTPYILEPSRKVIKPSYIFFCFDNVKRICH